MRTISRLLLAAGLGAAVTAVAAAAAWIHLTRGPDVKLSTIPPRVIEIKGPDAEMVKHRHVKGGLIAADVTGDGLMDFIVTRPRFVSVHDNSGRPLWSKLVDIQVTMSAERDGLPGLHAPGVQAGDIDADGSVEILYLARDGSLHIVDGPSGAPKYRLNIPSPAGAERWEHVVIANFRGEGDRDLLLQATNEMGYRMGRYVAAYSVDDLLRDEQAAPLWSRDDFVGNAHNGARVMDIDLDGRDEVLGATLLGADGRLLAAIENQGHIDSLFVADVRPDLPGLEVVALEEGGGERVFLYNHQGVLWEASHRNQEPQNAAVGEFDIERPGLEIWSRSRYNENQRPFVFDATGKLAVEYEMNDVAPRTWTARGVEVISPIHWSGSGRQLAAAKERHTVGDVAIFDPITGRFLHRFRARAERLYVADVTGDWREEIVILSGNQLRIYENPEANPSPDMPRLWTMPHYRRSKMTWNYYSP